MFTDSVNLNEEMVRKLLREELARNEKEKQDACNHFKSGTIRNTGKNSFEVICDTCGKVMGEQERRNSFGSEKKLSLTPTEKQQANKEYVELNKERGLI